MDHGQLSMVADKVHWVFAEPLLIKNGNPTPICTPLTPPILRSLRLIWTAIAAALKRFLAHMTQLLTQCLCRHARWPCVPYTRLRRDCPGLEDSGGREVCMMRWPWPSRISRIMLSARIPNGIGTRDARSWVSNPSLGAMTWLSLRRQLKYLPIVTA